MVVLCVRHAEDEGVALAAAAAERGGASPPAAAPQLQGKTEDKAGAAHADRMTESDGTAVDVNPAWGHAEVPRRGEGDRGEGLVDLDQVQVAETQGTVTAQGIADRVGWLVQQRGVRPGDGAVGADLGYPRQALTLRAVPAHHDDRAGTVGQLGRRTRGDRPALAERGLEPG